jgi:hypothetical protein
MPYEKIYGKKKVSEKSILKQKVPDLSSDALNIQMYQYEELKEIEKMVDERKAREAMVPKPFKA